MKDFIGRVQKDLVKLQKTLKKEIDDLGQKIKSAAKAQTVGAKTREIERLLELRLKKFEPAIEKFYKEVKANAGKYGIDLGGLEKRVKSARTKWGRGTRAGASTGGTKKKTSSARASGTKATTKRATTGVRPKKKSRG